MKVDAFSSGCNEADIADDVVAGIVTDDASVDTAATVVVAIVPVEVGVGAGVSDGDTVAAVVVVVELGSAHELNVATEIR